MRDLPHRLKAALAAVVLALRGLPARATHLPSTLAALPARLRSMTPRQWLASGLSLASAVLVIGAIWLAGYPFYTDWRAARHQDSLAKAFETSALRDAFAAGSVDVGSPLTRLIIPKLGVDIVVVEGTSPKALAAGAGHYSSTPLPGQPGNMAIAGHRNINGKPFADIDDLRPGDEIILRTPAGSHTYVVTEPKGNRRNPWVTAPTDWSIIAPTDEPSLTLTTCHPYGSNNKRLVVRAALQPPRGAEA